MNRELTDKEKLIRDIAKKNNPYDPNCPNKHLWEEGFISGFNYSEGANDFADKVLKAQQGDISDINFIKWYSGMEEQKIRNAYERYKIEVPNKKAQPGDEQYPKIELNKIFECGGLLYSIVIPQKASIETNLSHGRIICEFERSIDLDNFIPASK